MTILALLLRQPRFVGRNCALIALYLSNKQTVVSVDSVKKMGCCRYLGSAINETLNNIRGVALRMGSCLARCFGRCCVCSNCLPSAEAVGSCLYGVILFLFVAIGCPCFCTWIICRGIILWRRRGRDDYQETIAQDRDGNRQQGYKTFENDEPEIEPKNQYRQPEKQENLNYLFYTNQIKSEPRGDCIETILSKWRGDYELLEDHHGFIQWLFPLYESGVNGRAQVLNIDEREKIRADPVAYRRILDAYTLMLDFYGITLLDEVTGELERSENYQERFRNLRRNSHNYLRISRIIKCLEIFDYSRFTVQLVKFFITEIVEKETLRECRGSCMNFWIPALSLEAAGEMRRYAKSLEMKKLKPDAVEIEEPAVGKLIEHEADDDERPEKKDDSPMEFA